MLEFIKTLFTSDFMPHGHCYRWDPSVVYLHVISDSLIALAYYSIPLTLVYFVGKRRDLPYPWMFLLFGSFIVACGTTHLVEVWTVWHATYRMAGMVKLGTAILSIGTAILLVRITPEALKLQSPTKLALLNSQLGLQISEREKAEAALRHSQEELEARVKDRTEELARANAALQASLHEKEALLQEIHHRVKNNMQVVSSLLQLQAGYAQDAASREMLRESQDRIRSMALIHEKLYQSHDLNQVNFSEYLSSLVSMISRSYAGRPHGVKIAVDAPEMGVNVNTAIPLGLIINELVTNSLKHAFSDGRNGEIRVELRSDTQKGLLLTVRDNGVGVPSDFVPEKSDSLGLRLVRILAGQIDAIVDFKNQAGLCVSLTIPPCVIPCNLSPNPPS